MLRINANNAAYALTTKEDYYMCFFQSKSWISNVKIVFVGLSIFLLIGVTATNASAITAQEVMENALEVYEDIDNYKAVVQTYEADSMHASGSIFESQQPIISFNLFFRKPNEQAVEQIGKSKQGIFRVELLSALARLKDTNLKLKGSESVLGQKCYVLECTKPEEQDAVVQLWISQKNWTIHQFRLIIKSLTLTTTQFKYPPGGKRSLRFLPVETRSSFPLSKRVLINRITNYQVNINLSSEIFEKRKNKEQSK